jgi:predicted nucleic acid-binding protein
VILDTSAWIEFLRATGSRADLKLQQAFASSSAIWVPEVVCREVLQGAKNVPHFMQLQATLDELSPYVSPDPFELARSASLIYAQCRWQGITIRSQNDCLIAACAIEADLPLLHADRDFLDIASIDKRLKFV